jgi:hypothetical protein
MRLNHIDDVRRFVEPLMARLPVERAIRQSACGVAVLSPAIVLLFKAKSPREQDDGDFGSAANTLDEAARRWLVAALDACHPGHAWRQYLA